MYIKKLKINNFRNIKNCNFKTDNKLNIIVGRNAQGKTNILESIYYANFYKSFRTKNNKDLINIDSDHFFLDVDIRNGSFDNNIKIGFDRLNNRKILFNNNKPLSSEIYNIINTIIYYPSEINSLLVNPSFRRNLIDRSIFFIEIDYIEIIKKYNKVLKQRNSFLKNFEGEYDPWVDQLIDLSKVIVSKRINYVNRINLKFEELYSKKDIDEKYSIKYKNYNDNIIDYLHSQYKSLKEKEYRYGYTLFGPHVDDFNFFINGKNIKKYSSEGQKKYLLLSFKYAQLLDYFDRYKYYPIMLYDDYFSELDSDRQKLYFEKIFENSGQIFMTSTKMMDNVPFSHKLVTIEDGLISD